MPPPPPLPSYDPSPPRRSEKAADQLVSRGGPKIFNDLSASIAAGLGFGGMHTVMMYGALLFASSGEPTFFLASCPQISIFAWTAIVALLYNILHVTLMVMSLDAYRKGSRVLLLVPLAVHLTFGLLVRERPGRAGAAK